MFLAFIVRGSHFFLCAAVQFFCPRVCVTFMLVVGQWDKLTKDQIAVVNSLRVKGNKEILAITGSALRSVKSWMKRCRDAVDTDLSLQNKRTGKACLTSHRILEVLQRQLDLEPRISAKKLKEKNLKLLQDVSVHTIQ